MLLTIPVLLEAESSLINAFLAFVASNAMVATGYSLQIHIARFFVANFTNMRCSCYLRSNEVLARV